MKVENMDDDDITSSDITTATRTTTMTTMTEAIHDVMNNNLKKERSMNENEEANDEVELEVIRITMSIPELSSLPLENVNTTSIPEGNFFFTLHHNV